MLFLASYRIGRVVLHLLCMARSSDHLAWHWQGIAREMTGK